MAPSYDPLKSRLSALCAVLSLFASACTGVLRGVGPERDGQSGPDADWGDGGPPDGTLPDGGPPPDGGPGPDGTLPDGTLPPDGSPGPDGTVQPDGSGPPTNRFGIGLVGPGNTDQWNWTVDLTGYGGHIKLIFPGIDLNTTGPDASWVTAVSECYARELVPVIRLGPHWGDRHVRNMSDDASRTTFTNIAARYRQVVEGLPLRAGWPIWLEIHNEPNLCYEWECYPAEAPPHPNAQAGWMHYSDIAHEYAYFLRDVANALHAIGDPRIMVINGGLAPGMTETCECGGSGTTGGLTAVGFIQEMQNAVSNIWTLLDGWASHSYPSEGQGWGFFRPYSQAMTGLLWFETELNTIGVSLPVFITETGWTISHPDCPGGVCGSRQDVADWTVSAYNNPWLSHADIAAVMPFMLQDGAWDNFAWIDTGGNAYPVYNDVRQLRCSLGIQPPCP